MKEDPDYKYTRGSMAKFQEEWEAKDEERKELQKKVEEAKEALERERNAIRMSTNIPLKGLRPRPNWIIADIEG
jgi:hypothetical protein